MITEKQCRFRKASRWPQELLLGLSVVGWKKISRAHNSVGKVEDEKREAEAQKR